MTRNDLPILAVGGGLPAAAVNDLVERASVRCDDRSERPVGRISDAEQERDDMVVGYAEDRAHFILVADR